MTTELIIQDANTNKTLLHTEDPAFVPVVGDLVQIKLVNYRVLQRKFEYHNVYGAHYNECCRLVVQQVE